MWPNQTHDDEEKYAFLFSLHYVKFTFYIYLLSEKQRVEDKDFLLHKQIIDSVMKAVIYNTNYRCITYTDRNTLILTLM